MLLSEFVTPQQQTAAQKFNAGRRAVRKSNERPTYNMSREDAARQEANRVPPRENTLANRLADYKQNRGAIQQQQQAKQNARYVGTTQNIQRWIVQVDRLIKDQTLHFTPALRQVVKKAWMRSGGYMAEDFSAMNAVANTKNAPVQAPGLGVQGNKASELLANWLNKMLDSGTFEITRQQRLFIKSLWMRMGGVKIESCDLSKSLLAELLV